MKRTLFFIWALFFALFCASALAQNPSPIYAHVFKSAHEQGVWARAMVTDNQSNVYITGLFHGTCDFDPSSNETNLTYLGGTPGDTDGESDVFLSKYDADGNLVWAKSLFEPTFDGMNEERPTAITLDTENNLYLCGFTNTRGFFISKWSVAGQELWTRYFDDTPENNVLTFGIKPIPGGVVVSGFFIGTVDFDPAIDSTNSLTAFNNDGFLLSLNADGDFSWVKQFECNGLVFLTGLETTTDGEIVLCGPFIGSVDVNPAPGAQTVLTSLSTTFGAVSSVFLAKYSVTGALIWNKHYRGSASTDILMALVKKDSQNNFIVLTDYKGTTAFSTTTTVASTVNSNTVLSKADSNGVLLWAKKIVQTDGFLQSASGANLAVDACDNIYVSGEFDGTCDFDPSAGTQELQSLTNTRAVFLASYSPQGNYISAFPLQGLGSPDFVEFNGYLPIAIDADQHLIAGGSFRDVLDFDPSDSTLDLDSSIDPSTSIAGVFLAKYPSLTSCALANEEFLKGGFKAFPNPAQDKIHLAFDEIQPLVNAQLIDAQGRKVFEESFNNINSYELDVRKLPSGIYLLKVMAGQQQFIQKIIIQ